MDLEVEEKMELDVDETNVMVRVANLPLVSSTYGLVSSAYISTKENHPYLKSACEVAEKGVKNISDVVLTSVKPIVQKLEPEIALANNYACIGLDRIEQKLPILCQPTDEIVANATDMVVSAKEAVAETVTGAKDTVAYTITEVVEKTKGAVSDSMNTVLGSHMLQIVSTGVDAALTKSEALVDQYLPMAEEQAAKDVTKTEESETEIQKPIYIRLGSLSSKVRRHAYEQALTRVKDAKQKSQEAISKLHDTFDLMTYANQKLHDAQEMLYQSWILWKISTGQQDTEEAVGCIEQQDVEEAVSSEDITSHALVIAQDLSSQLKINCLALVASIQGLPQTIQKQAYYLSSMARNIYQNFHSATSFGDVSDQLLTTSKEQLKKIMDYLDGVMMYLADNTPLTWLVDPMYPQLKNEGEQEEQLKNEGEQEDQSYQQEGEHSTS
ncbi:perilipin-2 [Microcaecilia unicolor]|uniref:Perilipin n=1 Tax=Microcaecilia unicolor TaxID=1415580 RepID=A0A6P7XCH2_9AMPH|nr:perilipin-2-like [Microcaecilia unicolor]